MINDPDIIYWVWLSQILSAGNPDVEYILSKINSPKDLYFFGKKNGFNNIKFLSEYIINKMEKTPIDIADPIIEKCKQKGYEIITVKDKQYPVRLKNIYSCPTLFYLNGDISNIDDTLAIAIVGARKCSDYAENATKVFAKQLSLSGVAIISGMAVGVDGLALQEALDNNGRVIAVVGCGLDVDYPMQNSELKRQIEASENGCIISEYPPGIKPFSGNFPIRNRLMSGLSVGVLVVEAGLRSGSLITAKIAADQGKDVYGVPNNIFFENNLGTMNLLKDGAILVTDPDDIINQYKWQYKFKDINKVKEISVDVSDLILNEDNNSDHPIDKEDKEDYNLDGILKEIYNLLSNDGPQHIDYISEKLNLSVSEILVNITELELGGCIKSRPGMKYGIN